MSKGKTEMPNPSISDVEIFEEDLDANIKYLKENIQWVDEDYQNFAKSIIEFYERYDRLSEKQMWRACQFWQMVNWNKPEDQPSRGKIVKLNEVKREKAAEKNLQPVVKADATELLVMFARANEKLRNIVIHYRLNPPIQDINSITFLRRTYGHGDIGNIIVIGRTVKPINSEGKDKVQLAEAFLKNGSVTFLLFALHRPEIQKKIAEVFANPIASFAQKGKETGQCCFCGQELTNKGSVYHGYGPICAGNYGLPWSEEPEIELEDI